MAGTPRSSSIQYVAWDIAFLPILTERPALALARARMPLDRLLQGWHRLWGSVAFRLTLNYSLLAAATTAFLLIFAYGKIVELLQIQYARQVTLAANRLNAHHQMYGLEALQDEIVQLLSDQTDIDTEMYLLLSPGGVPLVGNLQLLPTNSDTADDDGHASTLQLLSEADSTALLNVMREGKQITGLLTQRRLTDGSLLLVGRDIADMREIQALIGNAVVAATLVAVFLVLVGTTIFRRELRNRVQAIRDTALRVGTGELTRRIPDAAEVDEFVQLRYDINHMLDRIESLMTGVQNVSDSIAHNLRTPLARVLGRLELARKNGDDPDALRAAIDSASMEIVELINVSEKLLLIAEAESGLQRQVFSVVSLRTMIADVFELYEPVAAENSITLTYDVQDLAVEADPDLLASAITNLIDNAFKYAGKDSVIQMRVVGDGLMARITVQDNGRGVPADQLGQLGTRFHRLEPDVPGFGLGLASVRAIVRLHGGEIEFSDAEPGLRVEIILPLANITER